MIARVWTGVVARKHRDDYVAYVDATGVEAYRSAPGCTFATILARDLDDDRSEITAFSLWNDEDSIRSFAGDDIEAMVLYPEDEKYLLGKSSLVHHDVVTVPQ